MDLLSRVISFGPPPGLFSTPAPRFRLIDLSKFESILEDLSQNWEHGSISLRWDDGVLTIMDVHLGSHSPRSALPTRKRKRVVDEDADSAAGNDPDEQDSLDGPMPAGSSATLANLSRRELKEVYTILPKEHCERPDCWPSR